MDGVGGLRRLPDGDDGTVALWLDISGAMEMKAESLCAAIIIVTILTMGWYAHTQKTVAEDLRGELAARCAL